jgi:uncharacterized protein YndB with AHSA1/START domain
VPQVHRRRVIAATPEELWTVIADPHHLPRWWPGVSRVEGVAEDRWTQVLLTKKGRPVRVDYSLVLSEPPYRRAWQQEIAGTPFERVLSESVLEMVIERSDAGSDVTLVQRQQLKGYSRTGGLMLRRATGTKLAEALDALARISSG